MNAVGLNMAPQGTILPGTTIQLGRYTVVIDRYIAEGGFAHVYLATLANGSGFPVVVKRIAVADKERLAIVNKEIETMKRLGKHKNIVEYMDSCMGKLEGGGYEVLILMEYCGGGPVIDLMNRRLQHRLTEPEILKIFSNVCEAVAYLHYSDPPILHRDIKVENILLSNNDYKLCDFGSATTNILRGDNIPRNVKDIQLLEEEINNHTTLQYRAPEMLDLYMRKGIDEKIDIWALGVLLYKLCYYTTPFEEQGQLAILNVRYTIPEHPMFSPGLISLFQSMLKEDPKQRPNIYQVMKVTSALRGLSCPIQNIYPDISLTPTAPESQPSATANILSNSTVSRPMDILPSIEPMRRGRPTRQQPAAAVSMQNNDVQSAFPATSNGDFNSGFDDSFGQFADTTDPVSKFSKIPPMGDPFDFSGTTSFDNPKKNEAKRFTLDLLAGKDEFGFDFASSGSNNRTPASSSSASAPAPAPALAPRPRPPSISPDLLRYDVPTANTPVHSKSSMPSQLSGTNQGFAAKAKLAADDLFFGSSTGIKIDASGMGSRSGTPSSFGSLQQAPIGLSSPSSNIGSQSSGVSKPLLPTRQTSLQSGQPSPSSAKSIVGYSAYSGANSLTNKNVHDDGTGNSRSGLPAAASPSSSSSSRQRPISSQDPLPAPIDSLKLLQRQQMEQLGKFSFDINSSLVPQNTQGKARVLDTSRTLEGMRSVGATSVGSASNPSTLASRPQAYSSTGTPSVLPIKISDLTFLDKKELSRRDMEAELKLIELQQKEFERQQQGLLETQRRQLEEQQHQHRLQQEQLQKQQQQQIQQQHEKWQERKRMLKEQEQLTQRQVMQQRDLQKQHEWQQQQNQQQQQEPQQQSRDMYMKSIPGTGPIQHSAVLYSGGSLTNGRASMDEQERLKSGGTSAQSSFMSSPATTSPYLNSDSSTMTTPVVPVKSTRRIGMTGSGTSSTSTASASSSTTPAAASGSKARRTSVNCLPPGQKPELLPKPTRFRMRDDTGTLVAGEEEAFKKKFPSADLDDDLIQFQTSPSSATRNRDIGSNYDSPVQGSAALNGHLHGNTQYLSPSQRARELRLISSSSARTEAEEEEEEEETLVRSRHHQVKSPAPVSSASPSASPSSSSNGRAHAAVQDSAEESMTPIESVRERVQRMNRVGRIA
ncbi:hypothetical protein BGZ54_004052 [Gamsiella multidivaricata]|nr:hypothetical protein BGZ54_004052 [Gamsiella multidivaricata]